MFLYFFSSILGVVVKKERLMILEHKSIAESVSNFVTHLENNFQYNKDSLLTFAVSLQPNFLVWCSALSFNQGLKNSTRKLAFENAKEEFFGTVDEGCHAILALSFFKQLGEIRIDHYQKAEKEIHEVYKNINDGIILLTLITCIELWSANAMNKIMKVMQDNNVSDFYYIEIHKMVDNHKDGHSNQFLQVLETENSDLEKIKQGMILFKNLFVKIFN